MAESSQKRSKRAPAFTPDEMSILIEEVSKDKETLFGGTMGKKDLEAKSRAWKRIAWEMSPFSPCGVRGWMSVRKKWHEFQSLTKKKAARIKRESQATGGQGPGETTLSANEERVMSIIGRTASQGIKEGVDVKVEESLPPAISDEEPSGSGVSPAVPNIRQPEREPSVTPTPKHRGGSYVHLRRGFSRRPTLGCSCREKLIALEKEKLRVLQKIEEQLQQSNSLQKDLLEVKKEKLELLKEQLALEGAPYERGVISDRNCIH